MRSYGYGWFWLQYDHNHAALVPPSTAYPTPPLNWWHEEGCAVDRTHGFGCTCTKGATDVPPDTYLAKEESR